ncbi:MAG: hypothetical protein HC811_09590 [Flammeovirgaceae bacterium]|nr:hypothetical protein [Flammeovirgaceae bacterium]
MGLTVNGKEIGEEINLSKKGKVEVRGFMRSALPMDKLEIIQNGNIVKEIPLNGDRKNADFAVTLPVTTSGWILLRTYSNHQKENLDLYPYATTNSIFVNVAGKTPNSAEDADYFLTWIDRIEEAAHRATSYIDDEEKSRIIDDIKKARSVFERKK